MWQWVSYWRPLLLIGVGINQAGCFATRADLYILLEQQQQLAQRLSRMQDHMADLTLRVQGLRTDVRGVKGEMVAVDRAQQPVLDEIRRLNARVEKVEKQETVVGRIDTYHQEREQSESLVLSTPEQMYEAAISSYAAAETDRAMTLFTELQRKWPGNRYATGARVKTGKILAERTAYLEAIDALLGVIENKPDSSWAPEAYLILGQTLISIDQEDTGRQILNDLLSFYPAAPETTPASAVLFALDNSTVGTTAPTTAPTEATAPSEISASNDDATEMVEISPVSAVTQPPVKIKTVTSEELGPP